ncbi:MAG: hypothetical protein ACK4IA_16555 [Paracoccus hibiscisoli]|uniref:hypothetical protein n=1 Tax=Paracoccus hibiscisoli TaxID=2023261 RepID=UPI00391DDB44
MEDWQAIAAEVSEALADVGYTATLTRSTATGPRYEWDGPADPVMQTFSLNVVEDAFTTRYSRDDGGALIPRSVRVLMVAAAGEAPRMGDRVILPDGPHEIARVAPLQPGGTALLYEVEIAA